MTAVATVAGIGAATRPDAAASGLEGGGVPATAAVAQATGTSLVRLAYSFVSDSGRGHPNPGAEVDLIFAAGDEVLLYLADPTEALAEDGTYSYSNGQLSIHISTPDLKAVATFPLSLSTSQVTMPFKVFSPGTGTSLWDREPMDLGQGIQAVYNAVTNASTLDLTPDEAADRALAYAQAWLSAPAGASALRGAGRQMLPALPKPEGKCTEDGDNCITTVRRAGDDIVIRYSDALASFVTLYSYGPPKAGPKLGTSDLAGDPRVYLDPEVHADSQFDPVNTTAAIVVPDESAEQAGALAQMASTLEKRHYKVTELDGPNATVAAIASALSSSPGVLLFSTHGNEDGDLLTGSTVAIKGAESMKAAYASYSQVLTSEGLGSLVQYRLPDGTTPYILGQSNCSFKVFKLATVCQWKVALTPAFWSWLSDERHVDWSDSMVFISACEIDQYPALLRKTIKAKAYFSFKGDVAANFATAAEQYLIDFVAHPTRSPEEAYYNMVRVDKTREMIYKEDHLLNGVLGSWCGDASTCILDGWGWNGTIMVSYSKHGWLSTSVDQGQVWWMLFAARWDRDAAHGAQALQNCYDDYWSKGENGGLADQFCNAANTGLGKDEAKFARDVAYAIYLLTGKEPSGLSEFIPPRWTLDD
jgi:hypothetical protein